MTVSPKNGISVTVKAEGCGDAIITAIIVGEDTTSLTCEVKVSKEEEENDDTVSGNNSNLVEN